jgi:predicted DNA-binding ribbon-helix-helix protein
MSRQPKIKSPVAKRSLVIGTRKTSITLEAVFWEALKEIADLETLTPGQLVSRIDQERKHANLSAVRSCQLPSYRQFWLRQNCWVHCLTPRWGSHGPFSKRRLFSQFDSALSDGCSRLL